MDFSFLSPVKIIIGKNESLDLKKYIDKDIKAVLLIHGASLSEKPVFEQIKSDIESIYKVFTYQTEQGEPSPHSVDKACEYANECNADAIIGIGGGSVMDTAKAVCALVTNGGKVIDYLEGVGTGKKVINKPLFFIAVPTTSGTGTEVTKNAVISSLEEGFKKSMRDDSMIADIAIIDPVLSMGLPKSVTASSGMDAICQLIESCVTKNTNSLTDALALHHASLAVKAIEEAYFEDDEDARQTMAVCAMVSGLCLANSGLGMAHGIAAGLGATLGIPHGIACGLLLPHVMRFNFKKGIMKYADLGEAFAGKKFDSESEACDFAVKRIEALNSKLGIPKDLKGYCIKSEDIEKLANASMGSSMSKNPIEVNHGECADFLRELI